MNELLTRLRQEANRIGYGAQFDEIVRQYPAEANGARLRSAADFDLALSWDPDDFGSAERVAELIRDTAEANGFTVARCVVR